jgi:peptidoglycan/LPS O-acetylase OafA/YrhL
MAAVRAVDHRKDIDGLRAVAVLAVIVHHASPRVLPGGFIGVDVFFVISGFLITSIILRDLDAGTFSFATFYERRVRRLAPNLTLLLVFCSCVAWFLLLPADFRNYSKSLFSTSIFTSNMFFWRDSWYFAAPSQTKPLLHTWSLGIEEQYYLLFPAVLWLLKRYFPDRIRFACVVGFAASLALSIWAVRNTPAAAFYLLPSRAWELLLGSVLVVGVLPKTDSIRALELLSATGLIAIVTATLIFDTSTPFPGAAALLPGIGAALVIYAGIAPSDTMARRLLSWRPLVIIGLMSYSLYLWHWPLLAYARYYFLSGLTPGATALFVGSSLLIAYLAWRFVEQPVRSRVLLANPRHLVIVFAGSSAVMLVFAAAGDRSEGWRRRFANVAIIDYDSVVADIGRDDTGGCFLGASQNASWNEAACTFVAAPGGNRAGSRRLFLIGDSFAAQFSSWLKLNFPGTIVELTASACPPLFDFVHEVRPRWCSAINTMREDALRTQRFTDVFLGAWWGQTENPETMHALERTVHRVLDAGVAHVIVLGTVPHFRDSPIDIVNRKRVFGRRSADTLPADVSAEYRRTLDRISRLHDVRVINIDDWVCRDGACPFMLNGELLFVDGAAHLTRSGVRYVMEQADWIGVAPPSSQPIRR